MSKALRRLHWMRTFEELVTSERPEMSGRIDWDTASHYYNEGLSEAKAAQRYCEARPESWSL